MLNLENPKENIDQLAAKYNICVSNDHYLFDGDLERLFSDSGIVVGDTFCKVKDWGYDENGWLIGCENGDHLETVQLIQNGVIYLCQAYSDRCGDGLDYMLALLNISKL